MAREALIYNDSGLGVVPENGDEWDDWVSAGRTRNSCNGDPLLDWLERHGEASGFTRDTPVAGTDFLEFIFDRGKAFETGVLAYLEKQIELVRIVPEQENAAEDIRALRFAEQTFDAMCAGVPVIAQAALRNPENRTYGAPDLLIRSDVLNQLFPGTLTVEEQSIVAPDLGGPFHYRVVDVKFTGLDLDAKGHMAVGKLPNMAQVFLYNRALGRLQGYEPERAYILGRGWSQTKKGETERSTNCMDRLGPVDRDFQATRADVHLPSEVERALSWVRRVRREGAEWQVLPEPPMHELRPNMKNTSDQPWHGAKKQIAEESGELTSLWYVGPDKRAKALAQGPLRWNDPESCAQRLFVTGETVAPVLDRLIAINRATDGPVIEPARVSAAEEKWRPRQQAFFVDFEWVSNLNDDFTCLPMQNGNPMIFMIGCGHIEDGEWVFHEFTADVLRPAEERRIIDEWIGHMAATTARLAPGEQPPVYHWSPAEESALSREYNAARKRHPEAGWPEPNWFDMLKHVIKAEPIVIRGAMGFGLKAVANALHSHGLISTRWKDGPTDGLGAMVGAWTCDAEATANGAGVRDLPLMREIAEYNEVDCRAMYDILEYLRDHH